MKILLVFISLFVASCATNVKNSVHDYSQSDKVVMGYRHGIFVSPVKFEKQALLMAVDKCKKFGYENAKLIETIKLDKDEAETYRKRSTYNCLGTQNNSVSQIAMIREDVNNIKKIKNPTKEAQLLYLKLRGHPENLSRIDDMSEEVQMSIVKTLASSISYIKNPTEKVQIYSLSKSFPRNGLYNIRYIENPTEKTQLYVIEKDPSFLQYIKKPYPSIRNHPKVLAYKKEQGIAELKRKKEEAELAKRRKGYSSSSSSDSSSTSSYSAPQRTCRQVPRMRTVPVPGNYGRREQQRYYEEVCN